MRRSVEEQLTHVLGGWVAGSAGRALRGDGWAVVVPGGFLLLLDATAAQRPR